MKVQECDEASELGHLRNNDYLNLKFCYNIPFSWIKLGDRNIGKTNLVSRERRDIWLV